MLGATRRRDFAGARGGVRLALGLSLAAALTLATPESPEACTLTTTGATRTHAGTLFTLNLGATDTGDGLPTSWTIAWGDGSIDTYAGNPASVTHTYDAAYPSHFTYDILASATCGGRTYFQNDLVVPSGDNDRINWYAHDATTNTAVTRAPVTSGPDAGLDYPLDAIVGPDGNVYVSGLNEGNVVRYDPATGAFIDEFADGVPLAPTRTAASGIAFGPDGNLYVGFNDTSEVLRFDGSTGAFIDVFVTAGSGGLSGPEGLTFGPDGNLYVSDFNNDTVYRYDGRTGASMGVFISGAAPRNAEDLKFGPDGNLYVASDRDHKVLRYDGTTGAYIDDFVASGSGGMTNAQGVAFGPDGNLYASTWNDDNVLRYDRTTGAFIDVYVAPGLGGLNKAGYMVFLPGHQVKVLNYYQDAKPITIQRSRIPGTCGTTLADYPMLFSVTDPDLAGVGSGGLVTDAQGDDIIFRADDDATCGGAGLAPCTLDHEIERYVPGSGNLVAWVRIPSVNTAAAASDTVIYVYYGNATVTTPTENPAGVWDAGYQGVWHLHDDFLDSTSVANDGINNGSTDAAGAIANGQSFDGVDDSVYTTNVFNDPQEFTLEAWFRTGTASGTKIFGFETNQTGETSVNWDRHLYVGTDGLAYFGSYDPPPASLEDVAVTPGTVTDNAWHHVVGVRDDATNTLHIYLDGVEVGTAPNASAEPGTGYWRMGSYRTRFWPNGDHGYFPGDIDEVRISTTTRSACYVAGQYDSMNDPGDIGYAGHYIIGAAVTAVELSAFTAEPRDEAVELLWETASETDNLGFHLYRGATAEGPWERITEVLVPGLGSSAEGARYGYVDRGLVNGTAYHYLLEDVETTGATERHGPVAATPSASAGAADPSDPDDSDPTADADSWIRYGDPEASALRVVPKGGDQVVLELTTGGFYALPQPDGTVRLRVPGFDPLDEAGSPDLPVRRTWIDAVAGLGVEVRGVSARGIESFDALRPTDAAVPEVEVGADGTLRPGSRSVKKVLRSGEGLFPEAPARVLETGFQGELKKALVELAPLRWDAVSGQLLLARRLEVTVSFSGRAAGELSLGGGRGRKARRAGGGDRATDEARVVAYFSAPAPGLQGVAFEDVFPGERRALATSALRLSRRGADVPFHVAPDPRRFGPGSTLLFVSEGHADNPDTTAAVFALESGVGGTLMEVRDARPSGTALDSGRVRRLHESDLMYLSGVLEAPDPWLWSTIVAPRSRSFPFDLDRVVPGAPGRVRVDLVGASDTPEDPDHHVTVSLNGVAVADVFWDGKRPFSVDAVVPPGVLREGANALEVHDRGDTGASVSAVYLDRFEVGYSRFLTADTGSLEAAFDASGQALFVALGSDALVFDTTDPAAPVRLEGAKRTAAGLAVRAAAGARLLAVAPAALRRPAVRFAGDVSPLRDTRAPWEYIAIGPRDFLEAAQPLLQWRREQGLAVLEAPVEDVYDAFSGGEPHTDAVRDLLSFAFHDRGAAPRYVLLLGDASYDGKGRRPLPNRNHVPPFMVRTPYMWTVSDAAYAAVNGDDGLPDLAIGRLPAASADEARALALKVLAREHAGYRFDGTAVLVADGADDAGDFPRDAEEVEATLLAGRDVDVLRVDRLGAATRGAIRSAFDAGPGLVSYFGHGAIAMWASENVFNNADVASLAPQPRQPFLLTMNCLNGYMLNPSLDSLAEVFLKREDAGAAAAFAPSSLSVHSAARRYHDAILREVLSGRHARLGDALLAAQESYAVEGALPDVLASYLLLGDPAASLP